MNALILSYALDTNGQNARFVKAAQKHGADVLNVLAMGKADPAGVVSRMSQAANKGDELRIRSIHATPNYLDMPHDNIWHRFRGSPGPCPQHEFACYLRDADVLEIAEAADVIHLNNSEMAYRHFRLRKPALLHHHGTLFRSNPDRMLSVAKNYRMQQCVSTIDLQRPAPDLLPWLPTAYDIDALTAYGEAHRRTPDGRVRIVHAPTNRDFKHTALFLEAVRQLQEEGLPLDLDLIEGVTWAECMERKAKADILYDQIAYGYGCNAVEAWGMGIPVIAGADEWTLNRMWTEWGTTPFFGSPSEPTTADSLKDHIKRLASSAELRASWGEHGHAHVRKYHDEMPALAILAELYEKAIRRYHRVRIPGKAPSKATFVRTGSRKIYDEQGDAIVFTDGKVTTDDPHAIERLRMFARKRGFGVEEVA